MTKSHKKLTKKISKKRTTVIRRRSNSTKKRSHKMRGGNHVVFPPSFSDTGIPPQSQVPHNTYSNDPNYAVISASNTGPFLTGVKMSGGSSNKKHRKNRKLRVIYGGNTLSANISGGLNTVTNGSGIVLAPAINELTGVAGIMSGFSNTGTAYNSSPVTIVPLA